MRDRRHLQALVALVLTNYFAQVPYELHLYGLAAANPRGVLLLVATLVWFVAGATLLRHGRAVGYWLLLSFLAVEFTFYFRNDVLLIPAGYGLPYHLTHARDALVRVVLAIGDLNFLAAAYFIGYLLVRGSRLYQGVDEDAYGISSMLR